MSTRQHPGRRAPRRPTRKPGRERRQQLLDAAYELLEERALEDVSFRDIAERAEVPEGSAYHFFANRYDLFATLANALSERFVAAHRRPVPASCRRRIEALIGHFVDVGARVYADSAPARQLLIGGATPPQVKQADRSNDRAIAGVMAAITARHFEVEETPALRDAFYLFIEITDLLFMLSVIEHGRINSRMQAEARRAGVAYMLSYLGGVTARRRST
jgi:AcrR family transcriptional regulator